jgi:hypothetical protein
MNAVRGAVPQGNHNVPTLPLTQRSKASGGGPYRDADPRQSIADRYPAGLISDDELEALLGVAKP